MDEHSDHVDIVYKLERPPVLPGDEIFFSQTGGGDFWSLMADRAIQFEREVWEHDRAVIRSWMAGDSLAYLTDLAGREVEDVVRTL